MALLHTPARDDTFQTSTFSLKNIDGRILRWEDVRGSRATLVMFICNHCPYVKAVIDRVVVDCKILQENGVGIAAIMSNDTENYPEDSFDNMKIFAEKHGFTFPYMIDENQAVAKYFGAVCTPDIFGFNADDYMQYRGRVDSAGMNENPDTIIHEMRDALLKIAKDGTGPATQNPSMGCSIKWR